MERSIENEIIRMIFTREILGFTQAQLAELTGYSLSYVRKIETGMRPLTTSYLEAFCIAAGVSADYILFAETGAHKNE